MLKKKKYLVFVVSLLFVMLVTACSGPSTPSPAVFNELSDPRQLNASGIGEVLVTPDIARIYIGVYSEGKKASDALNENSQKTEAVMEVIREQGVSEDDIQTSGINVYPRTDYDMNGSVTGTTFVVNNSLHVTVRDLSKLSDLLDAVVKSGANNINGIQFDLADRSGAVAEAQKLAVANARTQAEALAEAAGVELGKILNLGVSSYNHPAPVVYDAMGMGGLAMERAAVPISEGQLSISVTANITFEIE